MTSMTFAVKEEYPQPIVRRYKLHPGTPVVLANTASSNGVANKQRARRPIQGLYWEYYSQTKQVNMKARRSC